MLPGSFFVPPKNTQRPSYPVRPPVSLMIIILHMHARARPYTL